MRSLLLLLLVFAPACGGDSLRVMTVLRTADGGVHVELQSYQSTMPGEPPRLDRAVDLAYDAGGSQLAERVNEFETVGRRIYCSASWLVTAGEAVGA